MKRLITILGVHIVFLLYLNAFGKTLEFQLVSYLEPLQFAQLNQVSDYDPPLKRAILVYHPKSKENIAQLYKRFEYCENLSPYGNKLTFRENHHDYYYEPLTQTTFVKRVLMRDTNDEDLFEYDPKQYAFPNKDEIITIDKLKPLISICSRLTTGYIYLPSILDANVNRTNDANMWSNVFFVSTLPIASINFFKYFKIAKNVINKKNFQFISFAASAVTLGVLGEVISTKTKLKASIFDFTNDSDVTNSMNSFIEISSNLEFVRRLRNIHTQTLTYRPQKKYQPDVCNECYKLEGLRYNVIAQMFPWRIDRYKRPPIKELNSIKTSLNILTHLRFPGPLYAAEYYDNAKEYENLWWDDIIQEYEERTSCKKNSNECDRVTQK